MAFEAVGATGNLILDPLYTLWTSFVNILPGLIAAILILILGYCVGYLIGHGIKVALEKIGLNRKIQKAHLSKSVGHTNVPGLVGELIKWFIFIIFLQVAAEVLNLGALSGILNTFVMWLPKLLVAIIILFAGLAIAHYIEIKMKEHSAMKGTRSMAAILTIVILFLVIIIGLQQIGIDVALFEALALGIGLGLGLRKSAEGLVKDLKKNF